MKIKTCLSSSACLNIYSNLATPTILNVISQAVSSKKLLDARPYERY
jgi:hypothetical protein